MKDGGPAFPRGHETGTDGMSLRDWFAGMALQGMISGITEMDSIGIIQNRPNDISEIAFTYADCMLKEREKWTNTTP